MVFMGFWEMPVKQVKEIAPQVCKFFLNGWLNHMLFLFRPRILFGFVFSNFFCGLFFENFGYIFSELVHFLAHWLWE